MDEFRTIPNKPVKPISKSTKLEFINAFGKKAYSRFIKEDIRPGCKRYINWLSPGVYTRETDYSISLVCNERGVLLGVSLLPNNDNGPQVINNEEEFVEAFGNIEHP